MIQRAQKSIKKPGDRYGQLTLVERLKGSKWLCKCDCGNTKEITTGNLTNGNTKSCGCLERKAGIQNLLNGHSNLNKARNGKDTMREASLELFNLWGGK